MADIENNFWDKSIFRRDRHAKKRKLEFVRVENAGVVRPNLQEYERALKSPHVGRDLSVGVWQESVGAVRVLQQKGKLITRMGFMWNGKLHLQPEEAMYLVDRANLLLFRSLDEMRSPLSVQEVFYLMIGAGVGLERYQIYSHLLHAGFKPYRHPARWCLGRLETPAQVWGPGSWGTAYSSTQAEPASRPASGIPERPTEEPSEAFAEAEPHLGFVDLQAKGRSEVENHGGASLERSYVRSDCAASEGTERVPGTAAAGGPPACLHPIHRSLVFDVFKSTGKFSRKIPQTPMMLVFWDEAYQETVPGCQVLADLGGVAGSLPIALASVQGGQVSLFCLPAANVRPYGGGRETV
eukprot:jgi/Botrbrau1/23533/Bobra.0141s0004.1